MCLHKYVLQLFTCMTCYMYNIHVLTLKFISVINRMTSIIICTCMVCENVIAFVYIYTHVHCVLQIVRSGAELGEETRKPQK